MQTYQNYHLSGLKSFWPPPPHQESPPLKGKKDKGLKNAADMDASPDGKKKKKDAAYGSPVVGAPSLHRGVPPPEKGRWGGVGTPISPCSSFMISGSKKSVSSLGAREAVVSRVLPPLYNF